MPDRERPTTDATDRADAFLVAYAPGGLPSYEAADHAVLERSRRTLEDRVAARGGRLVALEAPMVDRADAERAATDLAAQGVDLVVLQAAAFTMGDVVVPFVEAGLRLCLWAPDEPRRHGPIPLNGFVAMHLHAGVLRTALADRAGPFGWCVGDAGHPWFEERLALVLDAVRIARRLAGARVALVGGVAPTFLNVAADADAVARRTGARVVDEDLGPVIDAAIAWRDGVPAGGDRERMARAIADVTAAARGRVELPDADLRANVAVYLALADLARAGGYDALAVRDWPEFQARMGLHPGLAFSWLDEAHGVPVAAEGDVGGALSMLAARAAAAPAPGLARPPGATLLDVNDVDLDRDALLTWHCGGGPLDLADADGVRWTEHTTLSRGGGPRMGAVADLRFRLGPVTVLRVGRDGAAWLALDADVVDTPHPGFDGSRGWLGRFRGPDGPLAVGDVVQTLLHEGVEHHLAVVAGHHAASLRAAAVWMGARLVRPRRYRPEPLPLEDAP
jgi:L-fucose isomerase-like protein